MKVRCPICKDKFDTAESNWCPQCFFGRDVLMAITPNQKAHDTLSSLTESKDIMVNLRLSDVILLLDNSTLPQRVTSSLISEVTDQIT